ncbi:unnamed protein product [marine sediment metagenome]|uniref:Uncharacterized protein n=1 Tax=marine sediment metagenome TaxID=412755 RepID=X1KCK5_9ZZZZ
MIGDYKGYPEDQPRGGDNGYHEIERLKKELSELREQQEALKTAIHYPEHWDTAAYPTLIDAISQLSCSACLDARITDEEHEDG